MYTTLASILASGAVNVVVAIYAYGRLAARVDGIESRLERIESLMDRAAQVALHVR